MFWKIQNQAKLCWEGLYSEWLKKNYILLNFSVPDIIAVSKSTLRDQ